MQKTITLLLDGVGDRSYDCLDGKTPLQYAHTPNLDQLAEESQCGLMLPYKIGCSLGTDLAHFLIFGYDMADYPGRGLIDAIGEKHVLDEETLVLRASFAEVKSQEGYWLNSRFTKDLSDEEAEILCQILSFDLEGYSFCVHHSYDSHCLIFVKGKGLSKEISDADPFYINQYVMAVEAFETDCPRAEFTAELINKYLKKAHELLTGHPINKNRLENNMEGANMLLCKWAGKQEKLDSFYEQNGMTGLLLGKSTLLQGLSEILQLDYKAYGDFSQGIEEALSATYDYVHLHTKAPDTASHQKDPYKKVEALEMIDRQLGPLLNFDGLLIVTADHSTPCSGQMIHSGETVPFMAKGEFVRKDFVSSFDEVSCSQGSLYLTASDFMHYIHNATDRGTLYHLRAGKKWRNYRVREVKRL